MNPYIPTTMTLLCMAAMTVECCVLKRERGFTAERLESVTIVGIMGNTINLEWYLESSTCPFYKDNQVVYASEHIQADKDPSGIPSQHSLSYMYRRRHIQNRKQDFQSYCYI